MLKLLNNIRLGDRYVSAKNKRSKIIVIDKKIPMIVFQFLSNKKVSRLDIQDFCEKYQKIA